MSKNNVRIAIRDSTDSHNVAFFDNKAGIKYKSANLHRFLAGSASILTIKYNSKDIDTIRSGCKLAFRYKARDYWLNVMNFEKKGFEVELTAYSLGLELNNETRGEHKPANAMSIAEYVAYYDPEHALTIGVNEVSDKRIKLEWTGTDTILARLFSVANSFGAELDFSVELNDDYSLKRQVLNIYKKGNLGTNKVSQPVRVGKELKVINYSDNIKELRTAVRATGKDGLTIDGLNKKIYDNNKQLLYYSSGMTVYAPQSRDRFPSVGKGSNDNWIVEDLGETQYETKEALWGYLYSEIQKKSVPEITYEVEGAIEAGIGDTQTLIDDIHFEPALYVQARVSELEDDILTGKVTKSTFINFERKYSQIADILLKQVEALAEDAAPYIIRLSTNNGYIFKNGEGSSTITARLEKYSKDIAATWKWVVDNKVVGTGDKLTVKAEQVTNTMAVTVIAYVNGNEVVRDYMTFSNSDDGVGVESIDRYFTSSDQSDGVTIEGAEWSDKPPAPTEDGKYLWAYDEITYTDGTVTTTKPAAVGANFDVDAFRAEIAEDLKDVPNREEFENKIAEELATSKAEITTQIETAKTQAESNAKEYADTINQETAKVAELANAATDEIKADLVNVKNNLTATSLVANNAQAAVDAAKQELAEVNTKVDSAKAELTQAKQDLSEVASDLNTAKQELADSVTTVNNKVDSAKEELTQAKQDLVSHAQQLQTQADDQTELAKRVTTVETTANGTKTTVSELSKTVAQNGKDITSVTNRTKTVEDDLANTKTTLTQVQTTANSASQKTATLETGLNGLTAKFENLSVGTTNHFLDSAFETTIKKIGILQNGNVYTPSIDTTEKYYGYNTLKIDCNDSTGVDNPKITYPALAKLKSVQQGKLPDVVTISFWGKSNTEGMILYTRLGYTDYKNSQNVTLATDWKRYIVHVKTSSAATNEWLFKFSKAGTVWIAKPQFEFSAIASDYHLAEEDTSSKVAEYKQTADQSYASLSSTVQTLDGQVQSNKTTAEQTAQGFSTRIESLETYKDGETTRANQYFESAKTETAKQLTAERTAIANNYVAKSTYTSDVTGIRNDLTATTATANTVKTNLANYQASNDRAVANLQTNLQTANGNISSLKTKVEAVPGQITSAVSAVEGKIPTNVSTRNLILKSNDLANPHKQNGNNTEVTSTNEYFVIKSTGYTANSWGGMSWNMSISEMKAGEQFSVLMPVYIDSSIKLDGDFCFELKRHNPNTRAYIYYIPTDKKGQWFNVAITFKASKDVVFDTYPFYVYLNRNGLVRIKPPMLVRGSLVPSDYQPAFEDAESDITKLNTTLTQTSDGLKQLSTKVTSQGNTINTHTTQISALNTGLQAKVSQSEFNTLSGRVTTAENNITAKANELSSKISSVEGKIPTSVSQRNLVQGTSVAWSPFVNITKNNNWRYNLATINYGDNTGIYAGTTINIFVCLSADEIVLDSSINPRFYIQGEIIDKNGSETWTNWDKYHPFYNKWETNLSSGNNYRIVKLSSKVTNESYSNIKGFKLEVRIDGARSGKFHHRALMVTTGDVFPDSWSPAPEDAISQINAVSSELKQTKDGITLLATKTELNTAKNELQSGINTATNKANAAQNTANSAQNKANSNAQTINTHTTQISALNTGLQAKVSQSEFNTLSGRVTTAENNITAKANELSSKITSVEGKIPTNVSTRNLILKSNDLANPHKQNGDKTTVTSTNDYFVIRSTGYTSNGWGGISWNMSISEMKAGEQFSILMPVYIDSSVSLDNGWAFTIKNHSSNSDAYRYDIPTNKKDQWFNVAITFKIAGDVTFGGHPFYVYLKKNGLVRIKPPMLVRGSLIPSDYQPAFEDTATQISSLSSEFKQTTDAIKASVSSLDSSTVKSSSLTINADGIVMKAGKSTTDVANAIGSYFSVNQNAINLFSDKINVKGNMIVNGAITSDKIASKSINTAHLNGKIITADVISSNAVTAGAIKAGAVTTDKMSANSINGDRIAAGTLDAAKIKAGSITASQIASGTITSNQIKAGGISSANIAAGAITADKIAANSIDASKIAANAITANMITGGQLRSTNGATVFDLNAGTLTFNNNYGYIQRVASDKIFEITTYLSTSSDSQEHLTSAFNIRKSDNSRQAGIKFTLYNTVENKPTAEAKMNADALILYDSQNTRLFSVHGKSTFAGGVNFQGWGDIPIAKVHGGLVVNDIGIGGHTKSLLKIVEELCKKAGILWV